MPFMILQFTLLQVFWHACTLYWDIDVLWDNMVVAYGYIS